MANEKVWTEAQRKAAAITAIARVWKSATPKMVAKHARKMLEPHDMNTFRACDVIDLQCELTEAVELLEEYRRNHIRRFSCEDDEKCNLCIRSAEFLTRNTGGSDGR